MDISPKKVNSEQEESPPTEAVTVNGAQTDGQPIYQSPLTIPMLEPEVWGRIFESLASPDSLSVMNTCPEWNELLASRKATILWPLVLPFVMEYQKRQDILACRAVTRDGKRGIDQVIQKYRYRSTFRGMYMFVTYCNDDINYFLERNTNRSREDNPFITREVKIELGDYNISDLSSIQKLLLKFGHHIWRFDFLNWDDSRAESVFRKLTDFLHCLPNLQELILFGTSPPFDGDNISNMFPPLPQLESITSSSHLGDYFGILIRIYGSQLTALTCTGDNLLSFKTNGDEDTPLDPCLLPKLKNLRIEEGEEIEPEHIVDCLKFLAEVDWEIEALELFFIAAFKPPIINILKKVCASDLLRAISNFSQTLAYLKLEDEVMGFQRGPDMDVKTFPQMPKLRQIVFEVYSTLMANWFWEFIVATCRNLVEIQFIACNERLEVEFEEMAKQAFKELPQLERFTFKLVGGERLELERVRVIRRAKFLEMVADAAVADHE